jgi:hypothetical protein
MKTYRLLENAMVKSPDAHRLLETARVKSPDAHLSGPSSIPVGHDRSLMCSKQFNFLVFQTG